MADVLFVAVIIAFFGLCLGLVKACDRLIGPDELPSSTTESRGDDLTGGAVAVDATEVAR